MGLSKYSFLVIKNNEVIVNVFQEEDGFKKFGFEICVLKDGFVHYCIVDMLPCFNTAEEAEIFAEILIEICKTYEEGI